MLDTVGPELQVVNRTDHPILLQADTFVTLTPDQNKEATSNLLPINFKGLSQVTVFEYVQTPYLVSPRRINFMHYISAKVARYSDNMCNWATSAEEMLMDFVSGISWNFTWLHDLV